jgi:hypothetical protein
MYGENCNPEDKQNGPAANHGASLFDALASGLKKLATRECLAAAVDVGGLAGGIALGPVGGPIAEAISASINESVAAGTGHPSDAFNGAITYGSVPFIAAHAPIVGNFVQAGVTVLDLVQCVNSVR